jgi:hypothetical protein
MPDELAAPPRSSLLKRAGDEGCPPLRESEIISALLPSKFEELEGLEGT